MKDTTQLLGIKLAKNPGKDVLIAAQNVQDAINAANGPSSSNKFATLNDLDGSSSDLTPSSVAVTGTTDSTSTSTGSITTLGGLGVTKAVFIGTDVTLVKETSHTISVETSTTAATNGGLLTIRAGTGATSGTGGASSLVGGRAGATAGAIGGAVNITGGAEGAGAGVTGSVVISTPAATGGAAGNISAIVGASSSTTISPIIITGGGAVVNKPKQSAITVTGGVTATAVQLLTGYIECTGTSATLTLPTTANITTAIGTTPIGTWFDFVVNATNMTAGNVVTLAVGANMVILKQTSAGDSATGQLMTVTATSNVNVGSFRIMFDSATTCVIARIC